VGTIKEDLAEFFAELMDAMYQSQHDGDWSSVADAIENWKATASIEADPAVVAGIEQGPAELEEGQGISWSKLRAELELRQNQPRFAPRKTVQPT